MNLYTGVLDSKDCWLPEYELSHCLCLHMLLDDRLKWNMLWVSVKMSKIAR